MDALSIKNIPNASMYEPICKLISEFIFFRDSPFGFRSNFMQ